MCLSQNQKLFHRGCAAQPGVPRANNAFIHGGKPFARSRFLIDAFLRFVYLRPGVDFGTSCWGDPSTEKGGNLLSAGCELAAYPEMKKERIFGRQVSDSNLSEPRLEGLDAIFDGPAHFIHGCRQGFGTIRKIRHSVVRSDRHMTLARV
jgi:hypothetical protein